MNDQYQHRGLALYVYSIILGMTPTPTPTPTVVLTTELIRLAESWWGNNLSTAQDDESWL
jgi:hypothetical protein